MKKAFTTFIIAFLLLAVFSALIIPAGADDKEPVIIGFNGVPNENLVKRFGGEITQTYSITNAVAANLPSRSIEALAKHKDISYVEQDVKVSALEQTLPWGIDAVDAELVHPSVTGTGVKIAVIDTGIDYDHPDLDGNYKGGYDFVNEDSDPMDDQGHGTHVAGTIAAEDNGFGVIGVAPDADLYALKVLSSTGSGYTSDVVAAIQWSVTNDMDIISMSLGSDSESASLRSAVDNAYSSGIVIVAAAGNDGNKPGKGDNIDYPGRYSSVIAVGAIDSSSKRAGWSSTGPDLEIVAPGVSVYSTAWDDSYSTKSGTSMATPHVAGAAALMLSADSSLTNVQVRERLQNTADDLGASGRDTKYGYGLLDVDEAVPIPSNQPLTVDITNPVSGATVSDTITIQASASGDNGVTSVAFSIDGAWVETDTEAPYQMLWDTSLVSDGSHTITALATDSTGFTASDSVSVSVQNTLTGDSLHISGIDMWSIKRGKNYKVYTEVAVVDADGIGVQGTTVYLEMTLPNGGTATGSGLTGADGTVTFVYGSTKMTGTYSSLVTDVTKAGWIYDSASNVETSETIDV